MGSTGRSFQESRKTSPWCWSSSLCLREDSRCFILISSPCVIIVSMMLSLISYIGFSHIFLILCPKLKTRVVFHCIKGGITMEINNPKLISIYLLAKVPSSLESIRVNPIKKSKWKAFSIEKRKESSMIMLDDSSSLGLTRSD